MLNKLGALSKSYYEGVLQWCVSGVPFTDDPSLRWCTEVTGIGL